MISNCLISIVFGENVLMKTMVRKISRLAVMTGLIALSATAAAKEVRIYNWTDYIDPDLITEFTQKTGIDVVYDTFDSNDVLLAKSLAGNSGYDIVVPSDYTVAYLIQANRLDPINTDKLPNLKNVWPFVTERLAEFKGMNEHSVPYFWGTTGIAYDAKKIQELVPDAPLDSLELIMNPKYAEKLASCGIYMIDSPSETLPVVNMYLGLPAESTDKADLEKAYGALKQIRPYIKKFHSSEYITALANGDACVALGWSGDIYLAKARAKEAKTNVDIQYFIPKEGSLVWFDQFTVLKDAPNKDEAYEFINFMLDPKNNARAANYVEYATSNEAAFPYVDEYLIKDEILYPSQEDLNKLHIKQPYRHSEQKKLVKFWQDLKNRK